MELGQRHPNLRFAPALSEPDVPTDKRIGYVGDVAALELRDSDQVRAYLAGPPAMVESATLRLTERGIPPHRIHADAFYTEDEKRALEAAQ